MMAAVLDAENSTLCLNQTPLQVTFRRMPLAVALGDEASRHLAAVEAKRQAGGALHWT